jgi:hypothetical protein
MVSTRHRWLLSLYGTSDKLGYQQFIHPDNFNEIGIPKSDQIDIMAIRGIKNRMTTFFQLNNHVQIQLKNTSTMMFSINKRINNIILQIEDGFENVRRHQISYERVIAPTACPR